MRRFVWTVLLAVLSCGRVALEVEGLRCDATNPCGEGYACSNGHCAVEPLCGPGSFCSVDNCDDVTCLDAPKPECSGAAALKVYEQVGQCQPSDGSCRFPSREVACPNGCAEGRCRDSDPCKQTVCNDAPEPVCVGGAVRRFEVAGQCEEGTGRCLYAHRDEPCAGLCSAGVCRGALAFSQTWPTLRQRVLAVDQAPGSAGNLVLAVGPQGFAARFDGSAWRTLSTGTSSDLRSVWFASVTSAYVVGASGTLLRYDGAGFAPVNTGLPATADLVSVHGLGDRQVLVAGRNGSVVRYNGLTWTLTPLPSTHAYSLRSVFVGPDGDERVAGSCDVGDLPCVAYASSGASLFLTDLELTLGGGEISALGPSPESTRYALAGRVGGTRRHGALEGITSDGPNGLLGGEVTGIGEGTPKSVYAVTAATAAQSGRLYRFAADVTEVFRIDGDAPALSRNYSGGVVVADSRGSSTSVFRRGPVTYEAMELGWDWVSVSARKGGVVLLSAKGDLAFRPSAGGPSRVLHGAPGAPALYQVAAGDGFALAVGEGGRLVRWNYGDTTATLATNNNSALRSVCRVSDSELYAVGDDGVIFKTDGSTQTPMTSNTRADLQFVRCLSADRAVAVGAGGTVLRLAAGSWSAVPFPDAAVFFSEVTASADGRLFVLAQTGLWVGTNGDWARGGVPPSPRGLWVRDGSELYLASGAQVLRLDNGTWTTMFTAPTELRASAEGAPGKIIFAGNGGLVVDGR
ncbi:MAG: WD40/YVTN/BNR-like repeat-containing protein [Myxococcaceae bacterium]